MAEEITDMMARKVMGMVSSEKVAAWDNEAVSCFSE